MQVCLVVRQKPGYVRFLDRIVACKRGFCQMTVLLLWGGFGFDIVSVMNRSFTEAVAQSNRSLFCCAECTSNCSFPVKQAHWKPGFLLTLPYGVAVKQSRFSESQMI